MDQTSQTPPSDVRGPSNSQKERPGRVAKAVHCPHCGCEFDESDPRSTKDHRRFFKIISVAFANWPERHAHKPDNAEHLRAWLLCAAKHRNVNVIQGDKNTVNAMKTALSETGVYVFSFDVDGGGTAIVTPKSIKFGKAGQKRFNAVRDAVCEIIEQEIGVPVETLLREGDKAA